MFVEREKFVVNANKMFNESTNEICLALVLFIMSDDADKQKDPLESKFMKRLKEMAAQRGIKTEKP